MPSNDTDPARVTLRTRLHTFAVLYQVESNDSRGSDLDHMMQLIDRYSSERAIDAGLGELNRLSGIHHLTTDGVQHKKNRIAALRAQKGRYDE